MLSELYKMQRLLNETYDPQKDNDDILALYQMILENCTDKGEFRDQSDPVIELMKAGRLTETDEKKYLAYANCLLASILAAWIYEQGTDVWEKEITVTDGQFQELLSYFTKSGFDNKIYSLGVYACARLKAVSDPMLCYDLTKMAFLLNPQLAEHINVNYVFQGEAAAEHLTEACPFCGSSGETVVPYFCSPQVLRLHGDHIYPPAKLWMKCEHCQNYFTYNFPFQDTGMADGLDTGGNKDHILYPKFPVAAYNPVFGRLRELADGSDYMEVGIGNGEMLAAALEFGYHVDAVERNREKCERLSAALDITVQWCDFLEYDTDKKYDVIVIGGMFGHSPKPMAVLEKAGNMLKDHGVLWLTAPNYNSAYARMQKFSHDRWHALDQYTYVSCESLRSLLRQQDMEVAGYRASERYSGFMELFIKKT